MGDFKHDRRRGTVGIRIDEDDEEADDTDTDEEDVACSHRVLCMVAVVAAAGEEEESSSGTDIDREIGCVVVVKELENEEGSSFIMTVRLVLR